MRQIRILITDDHSLFRESLSRFVRTTESLRVVAECTTVDETLAALTTTETDLILLDYDLGAEQGLTLLEELKRRKSEARVLVVTAGMPDSATRLAMEAGAFGVFLKHNKLEQLITAIHRVAEGEIWLDKSLVRALVTPGKANVRQLEQSRPLTPRQNDVMRGILDGLTNKEIALKVSSSESSVKAVIQELFHKAGVRTRSQLVRIAIEKHSFDWLRPLDVNQGSLGDAG
jgi:two-component system, NarL family, nitrate/nitrite response regulator NarL